MHKKQRINFTTQQKLEYAKLMVEEGCSNKQIMEISGACSSAVTRWKKQYLEELNGNTPTVSALTKEQQEIQKLKKELWHVKRDNDILKKATALFAVS